MAAALHAEPSAHPLTAPNLRPDPSGRAKRLAALSGEKFDLVVVGGGITGAGIASLAAGRGARVALVERDDFGSGTSSATSKMLHGGLRYLQYGKVALVREALHERGLLYRRLGEGRVQRTEFLLPLTGSFGHRTSLRFGTWLYQRLSGSLALGPRRSLSTAEVASRVPSFSTEGVRGGVLYFEGVVDDVLLTLTRVGEAANHGAVVVNHVEALAPLLDSGRIAGIRAKDRLGGREFEVRGRSVINAGGVWASAWAGKERTPALRPSKGVHLVFRRERFPLEVALVLSAPAGRWVFALPYGPLTIVGTTDTDFPQEPKDIRADAQDVHYLLDVARLNFPSLRLSARDVIDVYAGLRPLLAGGAERTNDLSREDVVHVDASGLLSVVGGKLTTHRAMAERAVRAASLPAAGATPAPLPEGWDSWAFPPVWKGTPCPGASEVAQALQGPGGDMEARLRPWVDSSVRVAGAATLSDLMDRRLHTLQRLDPAFEALVGVVAREAQGLLGWSEEELAREREHYLGRARFETQAVRTVLEEVPPP